MAYAKVPVSKWSDKIFAEEKRRFSMVWDDFVLPKRKGRRIYEEKDIDEGPRRDAGGRNAVPYAGDIVCKCGRAGVCTDNVEICGILWSECRSAGFRHNYK